MLYKLRKKGVQCDTKARTIYFPFNQCPWNVAQIKHLYNEFEFVVQLTIV